MSIESACMNDEQEEILNWRDNDIEYESNSEIYPAIDEK